jgi:hypothetical protein
LGFELVEVEMLAILLQARPMVSTAAMDARERVTKVFFTGIVLLNDLKRPTHPQNYDNTGEISTFLISCNL